MKKITKCPICYKGKLTKVMEKHVMFGVDLGIYLGEKCSSCGEIFTDSSYIQKIESVAKQKGVWELETKTKIAKAGNSLAVRIPQKIAKFLNLKEGVEASLHPEANKLVMEIA